MIFLYGYGQRLWYCCNAKTKMPPYALCHIVTVLHIPLYCCLYVIVCCHNSIIHCYYHALQLHTLLLPCSTAIALVMSCCCSPSTHNITLMSLCNCMLLQYHDASCIDNTNTMLYSYITAVIYSLGMGLSYFAVLF